MTWEEFWFAVEGYNQERQEDAEAAQYIARRQAWIIHVSLVGGKDALEEAKLWPIGDDEQRAREEEGNRAERLLKRLDEHHECTRLGLNYKDYRAKVDSGELPEITYEQVRVKHKLNKQS